MTASTAVRRADRWPERFIADFVPAEDWYGALTGLLHDGFPSVSAASVEKLSVATQALARSFIVADKIIDADEAGSSVGTLLNAVLGLQYKAYTALFELFEPGDGFWATYESYFDEYAQGVLSEPSLCDFEGAEQHAAVLANMRERNALHRGVVAAFCHLSGSNERLPRLERAIDAFCIGIQVIDDLHDWRADLAQQRPTIVNVSSGILAAVKAAGISLDAAASKLFFTEAAEQLIGFAVENLELACEGAESEGLLMWARFIRHRVAAFSEFRKRIESARTAQLAWRASLASFPEISRERVAGAAPAPISRLLVGLLDAWQGGYGELRHLMHFPAEAGFGGADPLKRGDLFQRMLVADTIADAARALNCTELFSGMIEREFAAVAAAAEPDPAGYRVWKYFPDLPELPADLDDLAELMRMCAKHGRRAEFDRDIRASIGALSWDPNFDGAADTWIIPPASAHPLHARQRAYAERSWGTGDDVEVVANFADAYFAYDPEAAAARVGRLGDYFAQRQADDGFWHSTWYVGPYYGTYVVLRALRRLAGSEVAPARLAAVAALRRTAGTPGVWTSGGQAPRLSTSLALLALDQVRDLCPDSAELASPAVAFLAAHPSAGIAEPFIRMTIGTQSALPGRILTYGSRTLTDAFALRALSCWS